MNKRIDCSATPTPDGQGCGTHQS